MTHVNESGRSMVEMLGVLAIIGVLSIGGIAGYTIAMNRYRANEILDATAKLCVIAQTQAATSGEAKTANLADLNLGTVAGCVTVLPVTSTAAGVCSVGTTTNTCSDGTKSAIDSVNNGTITLTGSGLI